MIHSKLRFLGGFRWPAKRCSIGSPPFEDPSQAWKLVYPLPEIPLSVLCATIAGADDFVEIERLFADADPRTLERHQATDNDLGRLESRRHAVCHDVEWLTSDGPFPGEWRLKDLAMIAMVA